VSQHNYGTGIRIDIPSYGGLNLRPIEQGIREADDQIRDHMTALGITNALRLVAFFLRNDIGFHIVSFVRAVRSGLIRHEEIGGAVVFQWTLEGRALTSRQFLRPTLLHNDWSPSSFSIPEALFDDGYSGQIHNLDQCVRELSQTGLFT
jgi:hypothetical protein